MATTLMLALAVTLALAMLLVPAIGTVVFAQDLGGLAANLTANMTGNMTNMTGP